METPGAIAILYATREGQTAKIAAHIAEAFRAQGCPAEIYNLRETQPAIEGASGIVLAASVHLGKHEKEMVKYVRAHCAELTKLPTLFLSVSMGQAAVEKPDQTPLLRTKASEQVRQTAEKFFAATGFKPTRFFPVAGALAYTRYNPLVRWVMKKIAASEGASTDTKHDHEYTNWAALDAATTDFARKCGPAPT